MCSWVMRGGVGFLTKGAALQAPLDGLREGCGVNTRGSVDRVVGISLKKALGPEQIGPCRPH